VPEELVRRVIRRESRGNPRAISKGNYGLMQIRLGTARAMGYRGGVAGLLDADTNMTYAVKYLAGAYQAAGGNHDRAVRYYAAGYYYVAKRKGLPLPGSTKAAARSARNTVALTREEITGFSVAQR
jgi:soluble lytic murein transglycosylase-like protein